MRATIEELDTPKIKEIVQLELVLIDNISKKRKKAYALISSSKEDRVAYKDLIVGSEFIKL